MLGSPELEGLQLLDGFTTKFIALMDHAVSMHKNMQSLYSALIFGVFPPELEGRQLLDGFTTKFIRTDGSCSFHAQEYAITIFCSDLCSFSSCFGFLFHHCYP